jgi:predicted transcriptional regulator
MTAYELADWLDNFSSVNDGDGKIMSEISEKLRKQADEVIYLTKAEIESGLSRVKWAEALIKQLPKEHEGRNSWLLNYGVQL